MADVRDGDPVTPGPAAVPVPGTLRAAVVVLLLEALGLVVTAAVVLVETVVDTPEDLTGSVLQALLALVGAALVVFGARGIGRLQASARTPVLVLQLLALPVAYSLWFQGDGRPQIGAPIAVAALVTIFLLFAPPSRAALDEVE